MRAQRLSIAGLFLLLVSGSSLLRAATTPFTITATDVIMPEHGSAVSHYAITRIPITGTILMYCEYSGMMALAGLPVCPLVPPLPVPVTAGGTLDGTITFYPPQYVSSNAEADLAIAGALLFALSFLRRRGRLRAAMLMLCTVAVLTCMVSCISPHYELARGTFPYTIAVVNSPAAGDGPAYEAYTTISVTVP